MKVLKALTLPAFFAAALLAGCGHQQNYYVPPPPPPIDAQAVHDQGFHDGFDAARHDVQTNRPPSFDRHPLYRNPPVPDFAFGDYRSGFRQGYERFLHQPPPAY